MSGKIPALPPAVPVPYPKPSAPESSSSGISTSAGSSATSSAPRPAEHRPAPALSPADVSYVDSLMGVVPAQALEFILLKTGVPMPENLGNDVDTSV